VRIAVLTVSDGVHGGTREDLSGAVLAERAAAAGHDVSWRGVLPDERDAIAERLAQLCDDDDADVVLTTGGTGFAPRDVTPEAIKPLLRRQMDGFSAIFHQASLGTVGVSTMQSRTFAGQIADTFIFGLPGSTGACRDGWDLVLGLELDSRHRPCSLAGQIPRLRDLCA
jgi:molybdenum cofactor biosynthesis protein B